jgi:hypothetical protein
VTSFKNTYYQTHFRRHNAATRFRFAQSQLLYTVFILARAVARRGTSIDEGSLSNVSRSKTHRHCSFTPASNEGARPQGSYLTSTRNRMYWCVSLGSQPLVSPNTWILLQTFRPGQNLLRHPAYSLFETSAFYIILCYPSYTTPARPSKPRRLGLSRGWRRDNRYSRTKHLHIALVPYAHRLHAQSLLWAVRRGAPKEGRLIYLGQSTHRSRRRLRHKKAEDPKELEETCRRAAKRRETNKRYYERLVRYSRSFSLSGLFT